MHKYFEMRGFIFAVLSGWGLTKKVAELIGIGRKFCWRWARESFNSKGYLMKGFDYWLVYSWLDILVVSLDCIFLRRILPRECHGKL